MELVSLTSTRSERRRMSSVEIASVLLHVLLLAAFLYHPRGKPIVARPPGTSHGKRVMLTYSPGSAPAPAKVVAPRPRPLHLEPKLALKAPPPPAAPASGADALGAGDVTVALATFFPTPKPDLSQLPRGTRGDVVIDIVIDEEGKIVESRVDQSLGHGVDESVLATVQTWTFKPATKDGKPVASEQQLLFHYERG